MVQGRQGDYENNIRKIRELTSEGKNYPIEKKSLKTRTEEIKACMDNGAHYIEDVADQLGLSYQSCYRNFLKSAILPLPFRDKSNRFGNIKRKQRIDDLIQEGRFETLQEIGDEMGFTHEYIRQYLEVTNQYEIWEYAKKESFELFTHTNSINREESYFTN